MDQGRRDWTLSRDGEVAHLPESLRIHSPPLAAWFFITNGHASLRAHLASTCVGRPRGVSVETTVKRLATCMVRWRSYFGFCETTEVLIGLVRWVRLRLRCATLATVEGSTPSAARVARTGGSSKTQYSRKWSRFLVSAPDLCLAKMLSAVRGGPLLSVKTPGACRHPRPDRILASHNLRSPHFLSRNNAVVSVLVIPFLAGSGICRER
jgi:Group II intron, maturase-specific domain